jgi:hypothetical protein
MTQSTEINRGVREACPLSATVFSICINEILEEWNTYDTKGLQITKK